MKKSKTTIKFIVQGQINGKKFYDISAHKSEKAAKKLMDRIIRDCYPKWRGMDTAIRIVRRVETVSIHEATWIFASTPQGKVRSRLAELFVPEWLPKRVKETYKNKEIP